MANEVVKHHNDLNTVPMRRWSKEEMNFFFAIIAKIREKGTKEVTFEKHSLAELANYTIRNNKEYEEVISKLIQNVLAISYLEKNQINWDGSPAYELKAMNLFNRFIAKWTEDLTKLELKVKVSEEYEYVINRLESEFTVYELSQFTQLRSTYSKTLYRILKQWRTVGKKQFTFQEFKFLLDMPEKYAPSEIKRNVLDRAEKELQKYFEGFKVKVIKANTKGAPVIGYLFTWGSERTGEWIDGKYLPKKPLTIDSPEYMEDGYKKEDKELTDEEKAHHQQLQDKYKKDKPEVADGQLALPWETEE